MQNLRNFIISFSVGLVLFGVFAIMIPNLVKSSSEKTPDITKPVVGTDDSEDKKDSETAPVQDGKTFTAIVGGYDGSSGELDGLIFLKADKENKRFVVAAIPTSLSVTVTSTDPATDVSVKTGIRLKDFPLRYPASERNKRLVDTMHAVTGMNIDYYAFFDTNAALKIFEKTGGLYYTVPQDMYYEGTGGAENPEINLKAGAQVLGARQVLGLLRFTGYTTDERRNNARRAAVQADFISEAFKQILKADAGKLLSGVSAVLTGIETNFSVNDFADNAELITKFGEYSANSVVMTVDLSDPLEYSYSQRLFENYK